MQMIPVSSSNLESVGYEKLLQKLILKQNMYYQICAHTNWEIKRAFFLTVKTGE